MNEIELRQLQFDLQNLIAKQAYAETLKLMEKFTFFKTSEFYQLQNEWTEGRKDALFVQRLNMLVYACVSHEIDKISIAFDKMLSENKTKNQDLESDMHALEQKKAVLQKELAYMQNELEKARKSLTLSKNELEKVRKSLTFSKNTPQNAQLPHKVVRIAQQKNEEDIRKWFEQAEEMDNFENKIAVYSEVIKFNQDYALAYYQRGICYGSLKKHQNALRDFNVAVSLDSSLPNMFYLRGLAKMYLGMYQQAILDFKENAYWANEHYQSYYYTAVCYSMLKEKENAIKYLKKAIAIYPPYASMSKNNINFKWLRKDADFKKLVE